MKLIVENHFREKVMEQAFESTFTLSDPKAVDTWRAKWMEALQSWHSPYKVLLDCTQLKLAEQGQLSEETQQAVDRMLQFFKGFFLRSIVGWTDNEDTAQGLNAALPFEVLGSQEAAAEKVGLGKGKSKRFDPNDLRSLITIENDFKGHVVELSFEAPVQLSSQKDWDTLKSKMANNLMQWHSHWNLLVDCHNLALAKEEREGALEPEVFFERFSAFFRAYFMKSVIGYSPKDAKQSYPFKVYRSRHKAVLDLERIAMTDGAAANCASRKPG